MFTRSKALTHIKYAFITFMKKILKSTSVSSSLSYASQCIVVVVVVLTFKTMLYLITIFLCVLVPFSVLYSFYYIDLYLNTLKILFTLTANTQSLFYSSQKTKKKTNPYHFDAEQYHLWTQTNKLNVLENSKGCDVA